jgi:hypothetical protein
MPRNADDVETFLYRLNRQFEGEDGTYVVAGGATDGPSIAIRVAEPIVLVRVDIGKVPADADRQAKLFRQLLAYNTSDLIHAAYGIDGENIVLTAGLPLENLDMNELAAALSDIEMALARHIGTLHDLAAHDAS